MARATKAKQPEPRLSSQVHRALREGALYVFGAVALILWYALFTYNPGDPGPFQTTTSHTVSNGIGWVGAWIADLLFTGFGRPAYLFTVMVFFLGWMLYREQKTQVELTRLDFGLRFAGFLATLATSCALSTLHFSSVGFNGTAGGIIGQALGGWLEDVMKLLGASVLLFCLWVAAAGLRKSAV
jgi:S-DNA-T family DNA segregation ATPase FtsK/SpoIIIE